MRLITCENGHRYDPELTPECPECVLMDCGGFDFDNDFPEPVGEFIRLDGENTSDMDVMVTAEKEPGLRTCEKGHLYDTSLTNGCPVCALSDQDLQDTEAPDEGLLLLEQERSTARSKRVRVVTCRNGHRYDPELTPECPECAMFVDEFTFDGDDGGPSDPVDAETIRLPKLTGWLVGIQGPAWGRSFQLSEECNYIGSGPLNEVCIPQDATLSAEKHCVIAYDDVDRRFYVGTGQGKSILRLNGRPVLMTQELKKGDQLTIGMGTYLFVPLCGEDFNWADWPVSP